MPLCSLYLVSLNAPIFLRSFVESIRASFDSSGQPLVTAKVVRWIIPPWLDQPTSAELNGINQLYSTRWDLLLIFPSVTELPQSLKASIKQLFGLQIGIPSRFISSFRSTNSRLLHPEPSVVPPTVTAPLRTAESTKDLELTAELLQWIEGTTSSAQNPPVGAVSMLNLLSFPTNTAAKTNYKKYGQAFAERVGSRHGGVAKIVGNVIQPSKPAEEITFGDQNKPWDEIALAHYPTVRHFAAMVGSKDYQDVNEKYRKGSLRGTAILCCNELDEIIVPRSRVDSEAIGVSQRKSKI